MTPNLSKLSFKLFHYDDGKVIEGPHKNIFGNVSGIFGNVSGINGDVSGISGNVSDIFGNVSDIFGDVNSCNITENDREKGISIQDLIKPISKKKITLELTDEQIEKVKTLIGD